MKIKLNRQKIIDKIDEIANCLENSSNNIMDLMGGKAGEIIFWAYYHKYKKEKSYDERIVNMLSGIFDNVNKNIKYPTFANGLAGLGWVVEHLVRNDFIEADTDHMFSELDEYLYECMMYYIKEGNYDYLHGALGIALYFINRNSSQINLYLSKLVEGLDSQSIKRGRFVFWESILNQEDKLIGVNISLSHGLASIINILSRIYNIGILKEKTAILIKGAVSYLFYTKINDENSLYQFPGWIAKDNSKGSGRLAWCYNDLGIGISLWYCGQVFNNSEWKKEAEEIILSTTKIKNLKDAGVLDAGICHGAFGIGHIYNRMYLYTKNNVHKESRDYWIEQGLKLSIFKDGLAGYKTYRSEKYGGYTKEYGFLTGVAGIGLVLISVLEEFEPKWDEALLLS